MLDNTQAGAAGAKKSTDDVAGAAKGAGAAAKDSSLSLADLYGGVRLAEQGFQALKGVYDDVVGSTLKLSDQVRRLTRDIGSSAEESSKLIVAADNTGISVETLTRSLEAAIRKGHQPTIENLAKMADQYNAIQDPIARTKFLMDNFGKSGAEMGALMEKGSAGIKAFGDEAELTGQVMSGPAVKAAHDYEMQVNDLNDSISGLKVQVTTAALPALQSLTGFFTDRVATVNLFNRAVHEGDLSFGDMAKTVLGFMFNPASQGDNVKLLTQRIDEQKQSTDYLDGAVRAYNRDINDGHAPMADNIGLHQQESAVLKDEADKTYALQQAMLDAGSARDVATMQYAQLIQKTRDQIQATQDAVDIQRIQSFTQDTVTSAVKNYQDTMQSTQADIDKLTAKIADETAAQGQNIVIVDKGQYSADQLAVAQERLAIAEQRLTEYHGKSQASLMSLNLSVQTAQANVDKMAASQSTATTSSADYSKAIADDTSKLTALTGKQAEAEAQLKRTTGEFIAQQLALDMKLSPAMTLQLDKALGLINQKEYDLGMTVLGATKLFDDNKNGVIDAGVEYNNLTKYLADQQTQVVKTAEALPPLQSNISDVGGAAHHAGDDLGYAADQLDRLHDKTITVTVNTLYGAGGPGYEPPVGGSNSTSSSGGASGGYNNPAAQASGGDYLVSSPTLFMAGDAGLERATFTPIGQGGGDSKMMAAVLQAIQNLPTAVGRAIRDNVQLH